MTNKGNLHVQIVTFRLTILSLKPDKKANKSLGL